jgi:hypothetical protein
MKKLRHSPAKSPHSPATSKFSETLLSILRPLPEPSLPLADESIGQHSDSHHSDDSASNRDEPAPHPDQDLARSLQRLVSTINSLSTAPRSKRINSRVPDIFDGSDPKKLDTFVFQCSMYIAAHSSDFPDQESRVSFALSYLQDVPLDWFQGEVSRTMNIDGNIPIWFGSFPAFISELRRLFGSHDPATEATEALEALKFENSTKSARYTLEFNRHASYTGWNDSALAHQYYKGLPNRLKDDIARIGKPARLNALQDLVAICDARYWERQSEINQEHSPTPSAPSPDTLAPSEDPSENFATIFAENSLENLAEDPAESFATDFADNSATNDLDYSPERSTENSTENSAENSPEIPSTPQRIASPVDHPSFADRLANILGADGKLKPEERQRRLDHGLCLCCGEPGHMVSDCPRNTQTTSATDSGASADSSESESE